MLKEMIYPIVLAAGKGTRMKSDKAKVLHEVFFQPMLLHVLDALDGVDSTLTVVVTGHQADAVETAVGGRQVQFARQVEQLGTGHAVLAAESLLAGKKGCALILCGDTPLVQSQTLRSMIDVHRQHGGMLTVMTTVVDEPTNYGRILSNHLGNIVQIVEEKDATAEERKVKEVNAGIYCAEIDFLFDALKQVGTDNKQGEVYLTDIVEIANRNDIAVQRYLCRDPEEILGVNSRVELAAATKILQQRHNQELMLSGVSMMDPDSIFIEKTVKVGRDVSFVSHAVVRGRSIIGDGACIDPFIYLVDREIGPGTHVVSTCRLD